MITDIEVLDWAFDPSDDFYVNKTKKQYVNNRQTFKIGFDLNEVDNLHTFFVVVYGGSVIDNAYHSIDHVEVLSDLQSIEDYVYIGNRCNNLDHSVYDEVIKMSTDILNDTLEETARFVLNS